MARKALLIAAFLGLASAHSQGLPGPPVLGGNTNGGPPVNSVGLEGNYFLDTSTFAVYGPKSFGVWPTPAAQPPFSPTSPDLTNNPILSGSSLIPTQTALFWDGTASGTTTNTSGWQAYLYFHVIDSAAGAGSTPLSMATFRLQLTNSIGIRNAVQSYISIDTPPNAADASLQNYVSSSELGYSQVSAKTGLVGGANFTGYAGSLWGSNPNVWAANGAVHWLALYGTEPNTTIFPGADVAERYGAFIVAFGNITGFIDDAAVEITADQNTQPNTVNGIEFGGVRHNWPIIPTGTMLLAKARTQGGTSSPSAASGIDFSAVTFSGFFLKSTGFTVDGSGNIIAAGAKLPSVSTGTPAASACFDAAGNLIKKTTAGSCV